MKKEEYSLITKKYAKNIWRKYIKCVEEYNLLAKGDIVFIYAKGLDKSNEHLCQMLLTMSSEFKMYDIEVIVSDDFTMMDKHNCNKLVLTESFESIADNTLWEMLYNGRISSYLPKEKKDGYTIIRPLYLIHKEDIMKYYEECGYDVTETFLGEDDKQKELKYVRSIIDRLSADNEAVGNNVFGSVVNVDADMLPGYWINEKRHEFMEEYNG